MKLIGDSRQSGVHADAGSVFATVLGADWSIGAALW